MKKIKSILAMMLLLPILFACKKNYMVPKRNLYFINHYGASLTGHVQIFSGGFLIYDFDCDVKFMKPEVLQLPAGKYRFDVVDVVNIKQEIIIKEITDELEISIFMR